MISMSSLNASVLSYVDQVRTHFGNQSMSLASIGDAAALITSSLFQSLRYSIFLHSGMNGLMLIGCVVV